MSTARYPHFLIVVATVLTVYGIETSGAVMSFLASFTLVATVLTVYGIETTLKNLNLWMIKNFVATVLTVYGIETYVVWSSRIR